jgi:hypothetical protein
MFRRIAGEAGKLRLGCLFSLLVFVAGLYFGIEFFRVRFRFYRIQDEVRNQANFASAIDDVSIRTRLVAKADSLGLPLGPRRWTIRRTRDPARNQRMITITAQYEDSVVVEIPGFRKVWKFTFTPGVTNEPY